MSEYGGTMLFVSHDRYLLNKVPDKIVEIDESGIRVYQGNYDYYCEVQEREAMKEAELAAQLAMEKAAAAVKSSGDNGYKSKEQRRLEAQRKNRIRELEALIEEAETRISELEEEMTKEEVFTDYKLMAEKCAETDELRKKLEEYYEEWGSLE